MSTALTILGLLPFYLLGAFPTGLLISKLHGIDITAQGSGNVGATNVARVIGKRAGLLTLAGDILKGYIGVMIAAFVSSSVAFPAAAGAALVCGHCFSIPPFLRGGKGVATALGMIAALSGVSALITLAVFGVAFALSRIVSLSSLLAALVLPLAAILMNLSEAICLSFVIVSVVVIVRHRQNIQRLIEGAEQPFQFKSK